DVNQLFIRPIEQLLQETEASEGSTTLKGQALREQPLEDLTRSAAATGDDAKAKLQFEQGQRPVSRSLRGDTASITEDELDAPLSYWTWFTKGGYGAKAGWRRFNDRWLLGHLVLGAACAMWLPISLSEAARNVLLPLAGIFVGMSFAWVGNAQAILQSTEIDELLKASKYPYEEYVYGFQSAILAILVTLSVWAIAALGYIDLPCAWKCPGWLYKVAGTFLFALASLTLRECWHVVMGAQLLLISHRTIRKLPRK
ncbi:MAG: hypothetical protein ABI742_04775, partial [Gemmatimonadota bacterium]